MEPPTLDFDGSLSDGRTYSFHLMGDGARIHFHFLLFDGGDLVEDVKRTVILPILSAFLYMGMGNLVEDVFRERINEEYEAPQ